MGTKRILKRDFLDFFFGGGGGRGECVCVCVCVCVFVWGGGLVMCSLI